MVSDWALKRAIRTKSDDIAIYIVGEDNHNVATHVVCVFSDQDALVAPRAEQLQL